LQTYG